MSDESWAEAADGLDLHRNAILMRLVVIVISILYLAIQLASPRGGGQTGGIALFLGAGEILATIMALSGAAKFSRAAPGGAASTAGLAAMLFGLVVIAQAWTLWVMWRLLELTSSTSHSMGSIDGLIAQAEALPYVAIASGVAGMLGVLCVLGGISGAARGLRDDVAAARARSMSIAFVLLGIAYATVEWFVTKGRSSTGTIVALLAMLAAFGLVTLFGYLGTLKMASESMRRGPQAELPRAEIVG